MPRRPRSDSAAAAIEAAKIAALPQIAPPAFVRLRPEDRPFWSGIVSSRARDEWSENDLVVAAQLARCQRDIETESLKLEGEGSVSETTRGTPVMNPRVTVLERLAGRELALMRALQMSGVARGDKRETLKRRGLERGARQARQELAEEDDLLA